MPRVSKKIIDKKRMDEFYTDFWDIVALLETREEAQDFFYDLLTHTERKMLAKRLQVAMMLIEGHDYQTIKENVGVANSTVAKMNNWLNTGATSLIKMIERLRDFREPSSGKVKSGGKYMAGNLLMPALEEGANLIARQIEKRRRRRRK